MESKEIIKRLVLDFLSSFSFTAFIAREWDSYESDNRFKKIEKEISKICEKIAMNPQLPLENSIIKLLSLMRSNELVPDLNFRKVESCMGLLKEINIRSELGQIHDPIISYDECIKIFKNKIKTDNPEKELKLVTYELEKEDLIHKIRSASSPLGFYAISPKEYFFCKTDSLFQKWYPQNDAKEIVKLIINEDQEIISVEKLNAQLKWKPRRLNSAIAFLDLHFLIHHGRDLGGIKYIHPYLRLIEEAYFFLENEK